MEAMDAALDTGGSKQSQGSSVRKLKQSRLSFQVLSPGVTNAAVSIKASVELAECRKRKPSTEGLELGHVSKIGRVLNTTENVNKSTRFGLFASEDSAAEQKEHAPEGLNLSIEQPENDSKSLGDGKNSKKRYKKRAIRKDDSDKILIKLPLGKRNRLTTSKTKLAKKRDNHSEALNLNESFCEIIQLDDTDLSEGTEEAQTGEKVKCELRNCSSAFHTDSQGSPNLSLTSKEGTCEETPKRRVSLSDQSQSSELKNDLTMMQSSRPPTNSESQIRTENRNDGIGSSDGKEKHPEGLMIAQFFSKVLDKPSIIGSVGSVSDGDSSEEDIYMLCTPNSKSAPNSDETVRKLTPKQIARRQEYEKRQVRKLEEKEEKRRKLQEEREEKAREKEEQERQRRKEREEKDEQKRKEREEKEEIKRKEREEREEIKRKDREEKEKKRQAEIEQKSEEKRHKEEERRKKEEQKEEERKRKEEEKEAEEKRKQKVAQAFTSFFVKRTANGGGAGRASDDENSLESSLGAATSAMGISLDQQRFMPFCVKGDMRLAPIIRRVLGPTQKAHLEHCLADRSQATEVTAADLYLGLLKRNIHKTLKTGRTWNIEEEEEENDEIMIVDDTVCHQIVEGPGKIKHKLRAKFFLFEENRRPPFRGTWRKRSTCIGARQPFAQDTKYFDYEIDSDEEWEEEEPGESLHGSDDEKDVDPEEDYEVDNEFFVPHGHLSDEELQAEEEGGLDDNSPEAQKAKLKIMQQEFVAEMKKKTEKIKPRLVGCIWENLGKCEENNGIVQDLQVECSAIIWKMLSDRAMLYDAEEPVSFTSSSATTGNRNSVVQDLEVSSPGKENEKGPKKVRITDDAVKDLVRLVHGNVNNRKFLVREFQTFWTNRNNTTHGKESGENNEATRTTMPAAGNGFEFSLESIRNKIREIAEWGACPLEGPMMGKLCWTVDKDVLVQYDLQSLNMPNDWKYHLKGNKQARLDKKTPVVKKDLKPHSSSPKKKRAIARETKEGNDKSTKASTSRGSPPAVSITKFTKVVSKDEQMKRLSSSMNSPKTSKFSNTAHKSANQDIAEPSPGCDRFSGRKDIKKRVQLLMSVPRDQTINQSTKSNLISQYLANTSKNPVIPVTNETKETFTNEVIEIESS